MGMRCRPERKCLFVRLLFVVGKQTICHVYYRVDKTRVENMEDWIPVYPRFVLTVYKNTEQSIVCESKHANLQANFQHGGGLLYKTS